jgi:hypothetical protein
MSFLFNRVVFAEYFSTFAGFSALPHSCPEVYAIRSH